MHAPPTLDELFAAFVDTGCENSLQQLMRRSAPELRRLARRLGASSEDADDLVQETIIAAIEVADRWDRSRPLLPWLRGILTFRRAHLARDQVRRRTVANASAQEWVDEVADGEPDAAALAQQTELTADVRAALANLPARYQQALHLYLLEQRSPRQIAEGLQQPRATVRVHLHRGLQQLRLALQRWAAPVLAWLWMRPGSARAGTAARARAGAPTGLATALSLLVGLGLWLAWACLPASRPANSALASASALVATDDSDAAMVPAAAASPEVRTAAGGPARAPVLTVLAHDADGHGVRSVGITCTRTDGRDPRLHRQQAVTDEFGAVRWSLPQQGRYALQVDRGPRIELDPVLTSRTYRVVLRSSVSVRGRVLHQDGAPAAGASIWLGSEPDDAWHGPGCHPYRERRHVRVVAHAGECVPGGAPSTLVQ